MADAYSVTEDRDALYYPRIHIRNANWLKATLLCFPQVRRMVPSRFDLQDKPSIAAFRRTFGPRGPLLVEEVTTSPVADGAKHRLLSIIAERADTLRSMYDFDSAVQFTKGKPDTYQIHAGKAPELLEELRRMGLAWHLRLHDHSWCAVHPRLGEAIMSCVAIAIAQAKKLDIVTDLPNLHSALVSQDEAAVIDRLLGPPESQLQRRVTSPSADELAQLVVFTAFDVSELSPQTIAELIADGKDLRRFKQRAGELAATIPAIPDARERQRRLEFAAEQIIKEWMAFRRSIAKTAAAAALATGEFAMPAALLSSFARATSWMRYAAGFGCGVFAALYAGKKIVGEFSQRRNHPYHYLSRISRKASVVGLGGPLIPASLQRR